MRGAVIPITMVPGDSPIHKIAPLPKLVWSFGVLIISFMTRNPAILGAIILAGIILTTIAQIWKPMLKVMIILFPIYVITVFLQSIAPAFPKPWTAIIGFGPFTIYQEGIYRMKQDVKVNELVLKKGEKVKLMVVVEEDAVKAYAYPANVSYLKADRVLILYMFDADFEEGVFDNKYFHSRLMEIVEPLG